jgi:hypothetical protein
MSGQTDEYRLYDFRIFSILKKWLELMDADPCRKPTNILAEARLIHPCMEEYLLLTRFDAAWRSIQKNSLDPGQLRMQFPVWFDGLKTLKLVRHLSRSAFQMLPMFHALQGLLAMTGRKYSFGLSPASIPPIDTQIQILNAMRSYSANL